MQKKQIFILGAGVSGLSLAYFLAHKTDLFDIHVIEKKSHAGGWVDSEDSSGFFFEQGPRVFRVAASSVFLELVHDIGMSEEMIFSPPQRKYLWRGGKLHRMPKLSWELVKGVWKEWRAKPAYADESVWDFACRRFNPAVAHAVFGPLVRGIYGAKMEEISMKSGLPRIKALEEQYGSVVRGLLKSPRTKGPRLFSFQRGMKSFIRRLEEKTPAQQHYEEEILALQPQGETFQIKTSKGTYSADYLFSALPCHVIGKFLVPQLAQFPLRGTTLVQMGFPDAVLEKKGFGYLTSAEENEEVMGAIFDSSAFPQLNRSSSETRITFMLESETLKEEEARSIALKALSRHLKVTKTPAVSLVVRAPKAFPQYRVGHHRFIQDLETTLAIKYPRLKLAGNYLTGPGVSDCIARAKSVVESFLSTPLS